MKKEIIDRLLERFTAMIAQAEADRAFAQQEASIHQGGVGLQREGFDQEAQKLAAGYQGKIVELNKAIYDLRALAASSDITSGRKADRVQPGVIVTVADVAGHEKTYFVLTVGGGEKITIGDKSYTILAPMSPLGWAILNKTAGDSIEFQDQGQRHSLKIIALA